MTDVSFGPYRLKRQERLVEGPDGPVAFQLGNVAQVVDANRPDLEGVARGLLAQLASRPAEVAP